MLSNVYSQLSGLEDMVFNDFIKDHFIPEGDGRIASGSASLADPVAFWKRRKVLPVIAGKTKPGRLRGRQVLGTCCCCKRVNSVENNKHSAFT